MDSVKIDKTLDLLAWVVKVRQSIPISKKGLKDCNRKVAGDLTVRDVEFAENLKSFGYENCDRHISSE